MVFKRVPDILHLGCQPASDLNRWLIAKVLSRGLLKDLGLFGMRAISPELKFWAGYQADLEWCKMSGTGDWEELRTGIKIPLFELHTGTLDQHLERYHLLSNSARHIFI